MDGTTRALAEATVTVGPDAAVLALTLAHDALGPEEMLAFVWLDAATAALAAIVFAPKPYKTYDLLPPGLTPAGPRKTATAWKLTIAGQGTCPVCRGRGRCARAASRHNA